MRLFLNTSIFISVIVTDNKFSCQLMELRHGIGFEPALVTEGSEDIVSCIVHEGFYETSKTCDTMEQVAEYHLQCLIDLEVKQSITTDQ